MLVEKTGQVTFWVEDPARGRAFPVYPSDYLTYQQEKQMSFQPDMILAFAHYLAERLQAQGMGDVAIRAEAYVSLNGRPSRLLLDPTVDLTRVADGLAPKPWILPADAQEMTDSEEKETHAPQCTDCNDSAGTADVSLARSLQR
jgi:hypothetical protein